MQNRKDKKLHDNATTARGIDGDGKMTPIRESDKNNKITGEKGEHAEPKVLRDLENRPKPHTVVVDQEPCPDCVPIIKEKGAKAVVPSHPSNPKGSPKTAARKAATRGDKVTTREAKLD